MLQKFSRIYPPIIEVMPLFLVILIWYWVLSGYSSLPGQIPTHFNFQGIPDGWGEKSTLLLYPGIGTFLYLLITGTHIAITAVQNPKTIINLPDTMKEKITASQAESLRSFMVRCLFAIKLIITGLIAFLAYANLQVASNQSTGIGYWPFLFLIAILATAGFMLLRVFRLVFSGQ
jgi:uncharacterized membrane protein